MANRIILNKTSFHGAGSRFAIATEIEKVLNDSATPFEIFSELKANPTVKNVQDGVESFNDLCTGRNPRPTSVKDIEQLYRKAF